MRAQWKQRGGEAGEYVLQIGRGDKKEILAKIPDVSFEFPSVGHVLDWVKIKKVKRTFTNGNGEKVRYEGAEAVIADWFRKQIAEVQKLHKAAISAGETLTTDSVRAALDRFDPAAARKRRTTAESVRAMALAGGLDQSPDVQKLLALLAGDVEEDEEENEDEVDEEEEEEEE